jgi:hypothetical protein
MGGGDSWGRYGDNQPDGTNGWTLRFMWRSEGKMVVYADVLKSENVRTRALGGNLKTKNK